MPRLAVLAMGAVLLGCHQSPPNDITAAENCIFDQVPKGSKVSAQKARQVVALCSPKLDEWSRKSASSILKRPFNPSDAEMVAIYKVHRESLENYWLDNLSDEIQPTHMRM